MKTCGACGKPARKLVAAVIVQGPGLAKPGDVCGPCAATGVLIVQGDDRITEAATVAPRPQEPTGRPKLEKVGFGLRELAGPPPKRATGPGDITPAMAKVLAVVLRMQPVTRRQIDTVARVKRRHRDNILSALRGRGFVADGESGSVIAGPIAYSGTLPHVHLGRSLLDEVMRGLTGSEARVLEVLTETPLRVIVSKEEISRRTGLLRRHRDNLISRLKGMSLVDVDRSGVRAVPELFDGGARS